MTHHNRYTLSLLVLAAVYVGLTALYFMGAR